MRKWSRSKPFLLHIFHSLTHKPAAHWGTNQKKNDRGPGPISTAVMDPMRLKLLCNATTLQYTNSQCRSIQQHKYQVLVLASPQQSRVEFSVSGPSQHVSNTRFIHFTRMCITDYWQFLHLGIAVIKCPLYLSTKRSGNITQQSNAI